MNVSNGTKLRCINDVGQRIVKKGQIYTALVRDGIGSSGRVYIQEHRRFALLLSRFEVLDEN